MKPLHLSFMKALQAGAAFLQLPFNTLKRMTTPKQTTNLLGRYTMLAMLMLMLCAKMNAQVSVTATAGKLGPTSYRNLKGAFDAVNAGTQRWAVTIHY